MSMGGQSYGGNGMYADSRAGGGGRQQDWSARNLGAGGQDRQRRFSPGQMMDQAMDWFRQSGGDGGFSGAVRRNPLPLALIGAGIVWLALGNRSGGGQPGYGQGQGGWQSGHDWGQSRDYAGTARDYASQGREHAGRAGEYMQQQTERIRGGASDFMNDQPLVVAGIGIAVGAAIGALLPMSGRETRWMGEARDEMFERATQVGRQAAEQAAEAVSRAVEGAEEGVRESLDEDRGTEDERQQTP